MKEYCNMPQVPTCGGELFARGGNLTSPNYPLYYPPDTICTWVLQAPGPATVHLTFDHLALHSSDTIEVRMGGGEGGKRIAR